MQEVVTNPTSGSVDDSSNNSDAVEKTRRTMTVTFTGTPKYGMIDIARVQDLVDGVAAHAHSCMNPIVKVDNITEDLDVKLRVWCEGCGCVDFFDHFEHKRNDRSQWHGSADIKGTRGGRVKEMQVRMTAVCLCNPNTEVTGINTLLEGMGCGPMSSEHVAKKVGELVETAVFEVDREIDDETLQAVARNPESSIMRADGAGSGRAGNQAEAMATSAMAKNGPLIFSEEKKRKETGNTQLLEAPALETGLIRWKYVSKCFVTDLITDGCKQLKSAKERELLRAGTGKANDKKKSWLKWQ